MSLECEELIVEACLLDVRQIRFVTCDLEREQSVRKGSRREDVEREPW